MDPPRRGVDEGTVPGGLAGVPKRGRSMTTPTSEATRLLAANAFVKGSAFRRQILARFKDENCAVAPEIGIDLPLVARVCKFAEARDRKYEWVYFGIALGSLAIGATSSSVAMMLLLAALVGGAVRYGKTTTDRKTILPAFQRNRFDPEAAAREYSMPLGAEHEKALPREDQNLIVYAGFSPFVGAGANLGGWSFGLATDKFKDDCGGEADHDPVTVCGLYAFLEEGIARLQLPGFETQDAFFVHGGDLRDDSTLLGDPFGRPEQVLPAAMVARYREGNNPRIRHYRWLRVHDWGGELTLSYFLRCSVRGPTLFVEIKRFILTPLPESLRQIDAIAGPGRREVVGALASAPLVGLFSVVTAPLVIFGRLSEALHEATSGDRQRRNESIRTNLRYNYGASESARAAHASGAYLHYFQHADGDFYIKTLDREILDRLVDYLDQHHVSTADLRERQSVILNNGILVQGGDVKAQTLAVGEGAKATTGLARLATRGKNAQKGVPAP